jgi:hypothetical protein
VEEESGQHHHQQRCSGGVQQIEQARVGAEGIEQGCDAQHVERQHPDQPNQPAREALPPAEREHQQRTRQQEHHVGPFAAEEHVDAAAWRRDARPLGQGVDLGCEHIDEGGGAAHRELMYPQALEPAAARRFPAGLQGHEDEHEGERPQQQAPQGHCAARRRAAGRGMEIHARHLSGPA